MDLVNAAAAARMNDIYRYQRFIYDATRRYFLLGRTELIGNLNPPKHGRVLEVGCGTAWNLIRAARRYPDCHFYGIDISVEMLQSAGRAIDRAGLRERITLAVGDAKSSKPTRMFAVERFDRVFISYAVSMIPEWMQVLAASQRVLAPAGQIHLVDFGRSEGLPSPFRRLLFAWLDRFSVRPRHNLEHDLAEFARRFDLDFEFARLYRGYAVRAALIKN